MIKLGKKKAEQLFNPKNKKPASLDHSSMTTEPASQDNLQRHI